MHRLLVLQEEAQPGKAFLALVTLEVLVAVISPNVCNQSSPVFRTEFASLLTAQQPFVRLLVRHNVYLELAARVVVFATLGTVVGGRMFRFAMRHQDTPVGKVQAAVGTVLSVRVLGRMVGTQLLEVQEARRAVFALLGVFPGVGVQMQSQWLFLAELFVALRTVVCLWHEVHLFKVLLHAVPARVYFFAIRVIALDILALDESVDGFNVSLEVLLYDEALFALRHRAEVFFLERVGKRDNWTLAIGGGIKGGSELTTPACCWYM